MFLWSKVGLHYYRPMVEGRLHLGKESKNFRFYFAFLSVCTTFAE